MKNLFKLLSTASILAVSLILFSCEEAGNDITLKTPSNVSAEITGTNNNMVEVTWDVQEYDSYLYSIGYRVERATEKNGTYEKQGSGSGTFTDKDVEYKTTYYYRIQAYTQDQLSFEEVDASEYSKVVSITVETASLNPHLLAYQQAIGEGSAAVLNGIQLVWDVLSAEELDEFKVYRNGSLLTTENAKSYIEEYRYLDENVSFNQTYTYKVVAIDNEGTTYESEEHEVTPTRPEEVKRTAPSFVSYDVDLDAKQIKVMITDVSNSENDLIGYKIDLGDKGSWEDEKKVSEFSKDANGNLIILLNTENAPASSGFTSLVCKVRIHTDGGYSDWTNKTYTLSGY